MRSVTVGIQVKATHHHNSGFLPSSLQFTISVTNERRTVNAGPEPAEKALLRRFLVNRFSLSELKDLAFDLGVDHEILPHETKRGLARELITYFEHRDQLGCLMARVLRPQPSIDDLA
jgi:hypothetical protein